MQARVPKYIDIEDKIIFGLTWRQFIALGIGIGVAVLAFTIVVQPLATMIGTFAVAAGAVFAFVKINNRPMHVFIYSLWNFFFNPRRYIWQKERARPEKETKVMLKKEPARALPKIVSPERLHQLSVLLDIKGVAERGKRE